MNESNDDNNNKSMQSIQKQSIHLVIRIVILNVSTLFMLSIFMFVMNNYQHFMIFSLVSYVVGSVMWSILIHMYYYKFFVVFLRADFWITMYHTIIYIVNLVLLVTFSNQLPKDILIVLCIWYPFSILCTINMLILNRVYNNDYICLSHVSEIANIA